jgi:hypothetical protein
VSQQTPRFLCQLGVFWAAPDDDVADAKALGKKAFFRSSVI